MKIFLKYLLLSLLFASCSSTNDPGGDHGFIRVTVKELSNSPNFYSGQEVVLDAYVLGAEYNPSEDDAQFFILTLGEEPQYDAAKASQILFPQVKRKVRAAEDGYNEEVIKDCYEMSVRARKLGQKVTVFGVYMPGEPFYYYEINIGT